jgi:hypothetical protein
MSNVVPEAIKVHDEPSKCCIVPALPAAQPLLELTKVTPFRLSVVEANGATAITNADEESARSRLSGIDKANKGRISRATRTHSHWTSAI